MLIFSSKVLYRKSLDNVLLRFGVNFLNSCISVIQFLQLGMVARHVQNMALRASRQLAATAAAACVD